MEENMGCRVVSAVVGSPDEPLPFLHSVSPLFGVVPVAYFWVSQAPRTSRDILGKLHLSYCELFAAWPKDGHILNLGFLICRTELMARGWGMRELSWSPLKSQRIGVVKAYYLMTMFKMEIIHWTHTALDLSDRPKSERNERNWSCLATGNKGQGPV